MIGHLIVIAQIAAAVTADAEAKRRAELGLPPPPPPPPLTRGERIKHEIAEWLIVLVIMLPGLLLGGMVATAGYILLKVAFAKQGIEF